MKISLIIPAYNEEKVIKEKILQIKRFLNKKKLKFEVIVVDDGSKDKTQEIVKQLIKSGVNIRLLANKKNKGKGYSVKRGMLAAKGDLLIFTDADFSTPINEMENIFKWFNQGYSIVIGSRLVKGSNIVIKQPLARRIAGFFLTKLTSCLFFKEIKDTQCGFKCFTSSSAKEVFKRQSLNDFAFDIEILYIAKKNKYRIKEMPITWLNSEESRVNIVKDSLYVFWGVIKIFLNNIKGKYTK